MAAREKIQYVVFMGFARPEDGSADFGAQVREFHLKFLELYLGSREAAEGAFCHSFSWPTNAFVAHLTASEAILVGLDDNVVSFSENDYFELH